ncbi:hypothetical protein [Undibacterium danionis]|uniref:Uncharacterized protein n=1 Tax=Undibacterium danionis TaxID=1812100 RepID=A0ABV6I8N4_9BURK
MQELNIIEVDEVGGSVFFETVGYILGWPCGAGAKMRKAVDDQDNMLLSGLQYGA